MLYLLVVQHLEDCSFSSHFRSCRYFQSLFSFVLTALVLTAFVAFFSLFSMDILKTCHYFVGCNFDVFLEAYCYFCQLSWKLPAVFVGSLGSFLFCQPSFKLLVVLIGCSCCIVLAIILTVLVGSSSCFFVGCSSHPFFHLCRSFLALYYL